MDGFRKAVLASALCLNALAGGAQNGGRGLEGSVVDERGEPIPLAVVSLNNSIHAQTDVRGLFRFGPLAAGAYSYAVRFVGYETRGGVVEMGDTGAVLSVVLRPLDLRLEGVTVTATPRPLGSASLVGQEAIRHVQPKSLADILQLVPGNLTDNPDLNAMAQAHVREIGSDANNALGAAVVVDGVRLSNDDNLQLLSASRYGTASSATYDGMSTQTTAGRGVDLRTVSAGNIEEVEVVRGIPSAEHGNLTSGLVIVRTKAGRTPWEVKAQADPNSKMVYLGKGFGLRHGAALNASLDWSQSWADVRRRTDGYDRITASAGYGVSAGPLALEVRAAFHSNVNTNREDPQDAQTDLHYKNKNVGARLAARGKLNLGGRGLTALSFDLSAQFARTLDEHFRLITNPDGVISDARTPGVHLARYLNRAYHSEYQIEGRPLTLAVAARGNRYFSLGVDNFSDIRFGVEFAHSSNSGRGLTFDVNAPPQAMSAQTLRPRAYSDIPGLNSLSAWVSDRFAVSLGRARLSADVGLRLSSLLLSRARAGRGPIVVAEPRANVSVALGEALALNAGAGLAGKMPTLLYLFPDVVYYDNTSLNHYSDVAANSMALVTTDVVAATQNPDLRPTLARKWEAGLSFRRGRVNAFVTFFNERHSGEFGFESRLHWARFRRYDVPAEAENLSFSPASLNVEFDLAGQRRVADVATVTRIYTWNRAANPTSAHKHGVEYAVDFGEFRPLRTSLNVSGAWLHVKRRRETPSLNYIDLLYDYVGLMPAGSGSVRDRVNTTFRLITHIPAVSMIFTTALQVVWMEAERSVYEVAGGDAWHVMNYDGRDYLAVSPLGYYDRDGAYVTWRDEMEADPVLRRMVRRSQLYDYDRQVAPPWAMLNFRFTKEIGRFAELSFVANNFTNTSRYHTDPRSGTRTQLYPDAYFGVELKLKTINNL